jgi:hypothetical protein
VTTAAASHVYSRVVFYLVAAGFQDRGMLGLLYERRSRRGPLKLTAEIMEHLRSAEPARSDAELVLLALPGGCSGGLRAPAGASSGRCTRR